MAFLKATVLACAIIFLSNSSPAYSAKRAIANPMNPMVSSLLKKIMGGSKPPNADALQLIKMAVARNNGNPIMAEEFVLPNGYRPRNSLPTNGIAQSNAVLQSNGVINNVMTQNKKLHPQFLVQPNYQQIEVARVQPVQQIEVARSTPFQQVEFPPRQVNPFLPAASPVSAIAPPTSNLLPPAEINRPRCNFLRKIPIPPPTL
ncbi:hypothetical protein O0L34_g18537 [Tuta absoluta]|nr:hypothetical protein O0L34_g18537 [Tuta absoluta]